ncbi:MAG: hypothetical protein WCB71_15545 [Aestuariivirga sp.]
MSNLHTLLPELSIFPLFSSVGGVKEGKPKGYVAANVSEEELAARISTAHALGMVKGSETARAEIALELEELRASHRIEMESARRIWVEEAGEQSIRLIGKALVDMESGISKSLHQVLAPFIEKTIPLTAMIELEEILQSALKDDFTGPLYLSGPEDLVAELRVRLKPKNIEVIMENMPGMELKARGGNFSVTTRIRNWIENIHGVDP